MSVKTAEKLDSSTKEFIVRAIKDIVSDPDFGLGLTDKAKGRLRQASGEKGKTTPLSVIKKK